MNDDQLFYAYEEPDEPVAEILLPDAWCVVLLVLCVMLMFGWW